MNRAYILHGFAAVSTILFVMLQFYDPALIREHIESKTYDMRLYVNTLVEAFEPPEDILIVTVDEKSIAAVGRWPWSRHVMARLVRRISSGSPRVLGIDIMFPESEGPEADQDLARALGEAKNVALATGFLITRSGDATLARPEPEYLKWHAFMSVKSAPDLQWKQWVVRPNGVLAPIETIANAGHLGSVLMLPDLDGILRWEVLYVMYSPAGTPPPTEGPVGDMKEAELPLAEGLQEADFGDAEGIEGLQEADFGDAEGIEGLQEADFGGAEGPGLVREPDMGGTEPAAPGGPERPSGAAPEDAGQLLAGDLLAGDAATEDFYPSLPLQVARMAMGVPMDQMHLLAGEGVKIGNTIVPTDLSGRMLINYRGPSGSIRYISAVDVLDGSVSPSEFEGRVVFLGTSATATYDQKSSPLDSNLPGVEKNATIVENILGERYIRRSPGVLEIVATILTALVLSALLYRMKALRGTMLALSLMLLYVLLGFYTFVYESLLINMVYPVGNMFAIFLGQTTMKFFFEERKSRDIRKMFSSYVSPTVVEALISNPEMAKLGGERREVTIMFSDIAGFTSLSENREPEEVVQLLNEYFTAMTDVIFRWEGTFDKIVGDEIMAFWGAPMDQPNHVELAIRCTLDMLRTLKELQVKWASEGKPLISCGFGLNTGGVLVGNIGALDKKMDYTVIGDHVNAAARVEALTRQYKAKILVTEFTAERMQPLLDGNRFGHIQLVYRDSVKVKGKERELGIYELLDTEVMPQLLK